MNNSAQERRVHLDLHEVAGGTQPPDLSDAILARWHREPTAADVPRFRRPWIAAAGIAVLGLGAVIATSLQRGASEDAVASSTQDPRPVYVADPGELAALPASTRGIALVWLTDREVGELARFRELRQLSIGRGVATPDLEADGPRLTDAALATLANNIKLERIDISFAPGIRGTGFDELQRLPLLRRLSLYGVELSAEGVRELGELPLDSLHLTYCALDDPDLEILGKGRRLHPRTFTLSGQQASARGIARLLGRSQFHDVTRLWLTRVPVGPAVLRAISDYELDVLDLSESEPTGMTLEEIREFTNRWPDAAVTLPDGSKR